MPKTVSKIAGWLADTQRTAISTGVGVSTESGIPDFRSQGGVWSKYRTVYCDEFVDSADRRHGYRRQKPEAHSNFADVPKLFECRGQESLLKSQMQRHKMSLRRVLWPRGTSENDEFGSPRSTKLSA